MKATHERTTIFFKKVSGLAPFFVVVDRLTAPDDKPHTYDSLWHLETSELKVAGVNYVADPALKYETNRAAALERYTPRRGKAVAMETLEERVQDAVAYLKRHHTISVGTYAQRTGLNTSAATRELRALAADPASPIGSSGLGSHKVYVLKSEQQDWN